VLFRSGTAAIYLTGIIISSTYSSGSVLQAKDSNLAFNAGWLHPDTFAFQSSSTVDNLGVSVLGSSSEILISSKAGVYSFIQYLYSAGIVQIYGGTAPYVRIGTRIKCLILDGVYGNSFNAGTGGTQYDMIGSNGGYATTKLGGGTTGLILRDSAITINNPDISGCSSHAIELIHSRLIVRGILTGSGNTGAGVYAHTNSVITLKNGSTPTITGTVGDIAISDPTVQESTWAAVDAGTPVAVLAEMTMVKEVA
jgi:hypothetical protein